MSTLQSVLLRCAQTWFVDHEPPARAGGLDSRVAKGLTALEAELLDRGYALTEPLRGALAAAGAEALADSGKGLLRAIDELLGADRTHMPLFRGFPHSVPEDTRALYVDRVFSLLLQQPRQPCVLCGTAGSVHPVSPCAHLVCRSCWDGAEYAGCPLCHRRIDRGDPFLRPTAMPSGAEPAAVRGPLRLLTLGTDRGAEAAAALAALLARRTPLSPQDRADLGVLLAHAAPGGLDWLPETIAVRETRALVLGGLLAMGAPVHDRLPGLLTTATDVLRLLCVWSGGEPDPRAAPRMRGLPRPLRRRLLSVLDALEVSALVEDLLRHPTGWKRAGEVLHPFEWHRRHPRAALAFAVLRETDVSRPGALGEGLRATAAGHPEAVVLDGGRIRARTWGARVEGALRTGDLAAAVALLRARPGELVRRLDQLMRRYGTEHLPAEPAEALAHGLPSVGPGPLLSALGQLRGRQLPGGRRVFFPRGQVARPWAVAEDRAPLPAAAVEEVCGLLSGEALRRLGGATRYDLAVLDAELRRLTVPFAERSTAASLVAVPRGSELPLPDGEVVRLFVHWLEPEGVRVDLDLSVAFFDAEWNFTGLCDYTELRYGRTAAVHSGDLTSAPAPDGATEYVDLDLAELAKGGARYAVPVVFSFNDIPFDRLPDAFAGFMALRGKGARDSAHRDASYDARAVRQRFDLAGRSRICVPMLIDLAEGHARWTDVHLASGAGFHNIWRHGERLGWLGRDLWRYFAAGGRVSLWELACWQAAARAGEAVVLNPLADAAPSDEVWIYRRADGESPAGFAARLCALDTPDGRRPRAAAATLAEGRHALLALVEGELRTDRTTGTVYRLFPGSVDGCTGLVRITAGELLADLA
ncbi:MXAN_6230/SCO0854 family RING domain-containing protein [Streptomyces sp. NPDC052396]|uniref:MXAN_6230/SCO0854 family RING domain-containing protein n=1 Tax=Streptomyces sp. NPDC052396 TaxID=3365689 RepID=UPI0037D232F9